VLILVAFYDTHELRWGYSLLPATTREQILLTLSNIISFDVSSYSRTTHHTIRVLYHLSTNLH